ncbi:unnamed protein product [Symbiodinium sp. CCMP2592]|nr:unnamed protein product [Symbiodinium sp. CCMP2592]
MEFVLAEVGKGEKSSPLPMAAVHGLEVRVLGWNIGGAALEQLPHALALCTGAPFKESVLLLQECPRVAPGWKTVKLAGLTVLSYRGSEQWRGCGIGFDPRVWGPVSKKHSGAGVWITLKHLESGEKIVFGSVHLTPGKTQAEYAAMAEGFLHGMPKQNRRVIVQGDLNAPFSWDQHESGDVACGLDGKALLVLDLLAGSSLQPLAPCREHQELPTSRPRQEGRSGSRIDMVAGRGLLHRNGRVFRDSCLSLNTDHELLEGVFGFPGKRLFKRPSTRPRVWVGGIGRVEGLSVTQLKDYARECTKPVPSRAYRDSKAIKEAFRLAKVSKSREQWKAALKARREARRKWEEDRVWRASQCDWKAIKDIKLEGQVSWDSGFADHQTEDPHEVVARHLRKQYEGRPTARVVQPGGSVVAFTVEEVKVAVDQMKSGKSVGVDCTCKELFQGLLEVEGGASHLAEFFTQILATQSVPGEWNHVLMILLAKVPCPKEARDLRPIALSSGSSKLFARLLLNRCLPKLSARSPAQCARQHRQCSDYVFSIWRMLELCREWHRPIVCVKVDIRKAFDSVNKGRLIGKLRARLGDTAEMACWERLILDTKATLLSPWGHSDFDLFTGIKQGAVESPSFFSLLMEEALEETSAKHSWPQARRVFEDFEHENALFMDDGLLWGPDTGVVGLKLEQYLQTLAGYGLTVNIEKCQLYCSADVDGARELKIAGVCLKSVEAIEIMGLRMRKGMSMCELIQPLLARAGLWCLAALPPDRAAMGLLNAMQTACEGVDEGLRVLTSLQLGLVSGTERAPDSVMVLHDFYMFGGGCRPGGMWRLLAAGLLVAILRKFAVAASDPVIYQQYDKGVIDWWFGQPRVGSDDAVKLPGQSNLGGWSLTSQEVRMLVGCWWRWPRMLPVVLLLGADGGAGQPDEPFGEWPPFWFHHACTELAGMQARGVNVGEVLTYLAHVIGSRPDVPYWQWSMNLYGQLEAMLHDYQGNNVLPGVVSEEVQTWCRYVDQHAHQEFMAIVHPRQQADMDLLATEEADFDLDLDEDMAEDEEDRRHREDYNERRKLPMLVAQLHGLGERASSSRTRPAWVMPPEPPRKMSRRATTWEVWTAHALDDMQGWLNAGCDVSTALDELANRVMQRGCEDYTRNAMECLTELRQDLPENLQGPRSARGVSEWARAMEEDLFYGCSGLARTGGVTNEEGDLEEDTFTGDEDHGDFVALPSLKMDKKWLKQTGSRRRQRAGDRPERPEARRGGGHERTTAAKAKARAPQGEGHTTTEVRRLKPVAKKCPFIRREAGRSAPSSGSRANPAPTQDQRAPLPRPAVAAAAAEPSSGPELPPLSMAEAVDTWVMMLGLASAEDLDARPNTVLPGYTISSITETLWSYSARDRVTLVLAFQQLIHKLLTAVGCTIQSAIEVEENSRDGLVEVEVDEAGLFQVMQYSSYHGASQVEEGDVVSTMMTKGLKYQDSKYTQQDWWECLANLQSALTLQTKGARRANIRWMMRRLHHRDTDVVHGYLLGHARNRAGDLLALLTAMLADVAQAEPTEAGELWCLEWWQQVEVYLPIGLWSMAARGEAVPRRDPDPILFMRPLPDESPTEEADACATTAPAAGQGESPGRDEEAEWDLQRLLEDEREAAIDKERREREEHWHAQEVARQLREEERAMEAYRTMVARDWDDWAMWDSMYGQPRVRKRGRHVVVELSSGSMDGPRLARKLRVPVREGEPAWLQLMVNIEEISDEEVPPTMPVEDKVEENVVSSPSGVIPPSQVSTVPVGSGMGPLLAEGPEAPLDPVLANMPMEEYQKLYAQWQRGDIQSAAVIEGFGEQLLELFQAQFALMRGEGGDTLPVQDTMSLPGPDDVNTEDPEGDHGIPDTMSLPGYEGTASAGKEGDLGDN